MPSEQLADRLAAEAVEFVDRLHAFRDQCVQALPEMEGKCAELVLRVVLAMPELTQLRHTAREWQRGKDA